MKNYVSFLGLFLLVLCLKVDTAIAAYSIGGVPVEAEGESALLAKEKALAEGQVEAFRRLLKDIAGTSSVRVPTLTIDDVLPFVEGISIESEKTTATKYMGTIGVQFDEKAVQAFLSTQQVQHLTTFPPSLLVVPQYVKGDTSLTLSADNPLYAALQARRDFAPFYRAVVPDADANEAAKIEEGLALEGLPSLEPLLSIYKKDCIMLLRIEEDAGGYWTISSSFYPQRMMESQAIYKKFRTESSDKQAVASYMSNAVFQEMESRWRQNKTDSLNGKQILYLRVPVSSLEEWHQIEKQINGWSFFDSAVLKGIYLPQVLVEVSYKGTIEEIEQKLFRMGWKLTPDASGNGGMLTRRIVYE